MILYDTGAIIAAARSLSNGDFEPVEITVADYARMTELAETYIERPMGVTEIASTDRTDFRMVRPRHVDAFTLLPEGIGWRKSDSAG